MNLNESDYQVKNGSSVAKVLLITGLVGFVLSAIGLAIGFTKTETGLRDQFFQSAIVAWVFWMTIGFGGLFMVMVHHLMNVTWSVVVRRIFEAFMVTLPLAILFYVVIYFGLDSLYGWRDADLISHNHLVEHKVQVWLNPGLFSLRTAIYFVVLLGLTQLLYKMSARQNSDGSMELAGKMKMISGPGMVLFALVITFSSWDWIMSLNPIWYSTIFGVYVFAGSIVSVFAFTTLVSLFLHKQGLMKNIITAEHYHDLGKMMFAFTIFWAYIAYSQFFLIWYGNIPEETEFYIERLEGTWGNIGTFLILGHFLIPFVVLLSRIPKRNPKALGFMCVWMLIMHYIDLRWIISPNFSEAFTLTWMDITTFIGIGGIFLFLAWRKLSSNPLIPVKDPRLEASVKFTNLNI